MFNEGTERPFTSELLEKKKELKRKSFKIVRSFYTFLSLGFYLISVKPKKYMFNGINIPVINFLLRDHLPVNY